MRYLATKQECVCQQSLCILLFYYIHSGCDPFESWLTDTNLDKSITKTRLVGGLSM
jgi:hypothetical protein